MNIAVIGAKGFVGSSIIEEAKKIETIHVIPVIRGDDLESKIKNVDVVIHTANSASRYKAKIDPKYDFIESVEKTYIIKKICEKYKIPLTLISSISARSQLDTVYGINRRSCEFIVGEKNLIIRLGYMFSYKRIYGALKDIYEGKEVYLHPDSRYSFSDVKWNAKKILELVLKREKGIFELGAKGNISLNEIANLLSSKSKFVGDVKDIQVANYIGSDNPSIDEFIKYLKQIKKG